MKKIENLINAVKTRILSKELILLLCLPYLANTFKQTYSIPYFSFTAAGLIIILILPVEWIIQNLLSQIRSIKIRHTIVFFLAGALSAIFYATFLINDLTYVVPTEYLHRRLIMPVIFFGTGLLMNRGPAFAFVRNSFLLFFTIIIVWSAPDINRLGLLKTIQLNNTQARVTLNHKPVLLILCDEYHSPSDLYRVFEDSNAFNFKNDLNQQGWILKDPMYSNEASTITSISSMWNYNLTADYQFAHTNIFHVYQRYLMSSALERDLSQHHIPIYNFSIFDIGPRESMTRLYFYPKTFFELLMFNSEYFALTDMIPRTLHKPKKVTSVERHNNFILEHLNDTLNSINDFSYLVYSHILMPHEPLKYYDEFKSKTDKASDYFAYWKFCNKKLEPFISQLTKENKYRIILCGDHGYRGSKSLNKNLTFAAFYGFSNNELKEVKVTQDIGKLIGHSLIDPVKK